MDCKVHQVAKSRTRLSNLKKKGVGNTSPKEENVGSLQGEGKTYPSDSTDMHLGHDLKAAISMH